MSPRDATFQAMKEVSGPVIAIALILSVGLPAGGVYGRHSGAAEQSVRRDDCDLGAHFGLQRADPLAGACRAPAAGRGRNREASSAASSAASTGCSTKATHGYVNWSHALIRKAVVGMLILAGFAVVDGLIGRRLPTSFLPEEDYGYAFLNVQLPAAASLARTDQVLKKIEGILGKTEGVQYYNTIGGFSLLTRISASYQGFFFVGFKPWDERTSAAA